MAAHIINLKIHLKDMGIEVRFVDPENPQNFKDATDENTRAYYGEVLQTLLLRSSQ